MAGGYNVGQGKGGPEWYGGQFYNIVFCSSSFIRSPLDVQGYSKLYTFFPPEKHGKYTFN